MYDDIPVCSKCDAELIDESEVFPYDDTDVCQECYHSLSRRDEIEYQQWGGEGLIEYDE